MFVVIGKLRVTEQQDQYDTCEPDVLGIVFFDDPALPAKTHAAESVAKRPERR